MMNMFERAARHKLRFPSPVGDLTTEQLFDLPLRSNRSGAADLDKVARRCNDLLKDVTVESFVDVGPSDPAKDLAELRLDIVKHVIASKIAEAQAAEKRAQTVETKKKLLDALAAKKDEKLASMTEEELKAELDKLSAA